ncbi:hypothetical protein EV146_11657 [Mesobacillus foraminis]|uniref:Uncharacterized protein n=2 Tax=Mesobacillus foraminis TaxID=279826 RepID=A0A4R2B2H5_9BACI|nr:hypothetical protein EV146_11657 [Mesobacillus foraminis]
MWLPYPYGVDGWLTACIFSRLFLHVAWFAKDPLNWNAFIKWFSPFAAVCMLIILGTGFWVMTMVVDVNDYVNSWVLSYGQILFYLAAVYHQSLFRPESTILIRNEGTSFRDGPSFFLFI